MQSRELSNEDIVTKILSDREILMRQDAPDVFERGAKYSTNPNYNLSDYLKKPRREISRFGEKYLFVK